MPRLYPRHIEGPLLDALTDSPVVLLNGARQTGKSTLVQTLRRRRRPAEYRTLDDLSVLASAKADPEGFVRSITGPVILDEIQRAPELFLPIKAAVDRHREPGRFLLTGSANALVLPQVADTLVGRLEILTLWPLSQGEIAGKPEAFIDTVFSTAPFPAGGGLPFPQLVRRVLAGGYPPVLARIRARPGAGRTRDWIRGYVTTLVERDVRELAHLEGLVQFPRLLSVLAAWSGRILNFADLSRVSAMPETTLKRYTALLRATFIMDLLPAWGRDLARRAIRHPRVILNDTGLVAALQAIDEKRVAAEPGLFGPLLENFVAMELRKQLGWAEAPAELFHYRTRTGHEVDLVLERMDGHVVGIEIKATQSPGPKDLAGLRALQAAAGTRFRQGILLYAGNLVLPFGNRLTAVPIPCLWQWTRAAARGQPSLRLRRRR